MEGIYFALSILAIGAVIHWCRKADRGLAGEYWGLFAMRKADNHTNQRPGKWKGGERTFSSPRT